MLKAWQFLLFFLFCLAVALAFNLPVQNVLAYVKLPPTIRAAGIDGTVIRGKADEIVVNGFPLRAIEYRYQPSCIPLLKVCYRISYAQGDLRVAYDVLNGDTEVSKTRIEYPASEIAAYLQNVPVRPDGRLELVIDDLTMMGGKPASVTGRLVWRDLGIDDDGIKLSIGDYQVEFSGNPKQYDIKINDLDASLDVKGDGEIKPGGIYRIDVRIASDKGIDPQVKSVLELVAARTGHDRYRIEQSGRLPPNLTRQLF